MTKWLIALAAIAVALVVALVHAPPPASKPVVEHFPKRLTQVVTVPFRFPNEVEHKFTYGPNGSVVSDHITFDDGGYGLMTFRADTTAIDYVRYYPASSDGKERVMDYVMFDRDGRTHLNAYHKDADGWITMSGSRDSAGVWTELDFHPQSLIVARKRVYDKPSWWLNMQGVYVRMTSEERNWPLGQKQYVYTAPDYSSFQIRTFDELGFDVTRQDHRGRLEDGYINWPGSNTHKLTYALKQGESNPDVTYWVVETANFDKQGELTHKRVFNHSSMVAFVTVDGFGPVVQSWNMKATNIPDVAKRLAPENFFVERLSLASYEGKTNVVFKFMLSGSYRLREQTYDEVRPDVGPVSVTRKIRENGRIEVISVTANGKEIEKVDFEDNEEAPVVSVPAELLRQYDYTAPLVAAHDPDYKRDGM